MAKISSKDIFTNPDIYAGVRKSAQETIKLLDVLDKKLKSQAGTMKKALGGVKFDSTKGIKEFLKTINEVNKIQQQALKVNQARQRSQEALNKTIASSARVEREKARVQEQNNKTALSAERLEQSRIRTKRQLAQETEREAKAQARAKKAQDDANSAYKQLVVNTRNLKNQSKELGAQLLRLEQEGKKGSRVWQETKTKYDQVTASARKFDAQLKKIDKSVGDNFRNVGNYGQAIGKLQSVLATFGIAFGVANIVRSASSAVQDFEVRNSQLQAVTGKTKTDLTSLVEIQRELGRTTSFTAGEVASLQVELAKLGFTTSEIEKSTEGVLKLAKASGTDLANASAIAGATLRGFELSASNMQRVVDVMAKSFSTSALDIGKFSEAMKYVAPVANSAGISLEQATAMLGTLANAGISGSQAGTSLRRIISDISGSGKDLGTALEELAEKGLNLADAKDEVGRTAQTALLVLTKGTGKIKELTNEYNHAQGAVDQMAKTMDDNLTGSLKRLSSAWEGWILDVNDSSGASRDLKEALDWLAENLATILNVLTKVITLFLKWKVIVYAQIGYNKLMASSFMQTAKSMGGLKGAIQGLKGAFKSLGQAIKANIAGIAVMALYELYNIYKEVNDAMNYNVKVHKEIKRAQQEVANNTAKEAREMKSLFDALKATNNGSQERKNLIDEINSRYGTTLQNLTNEKDFVNQVNQAYQDLMATLKERSALESKRVAFEISQRSLTELEMEMKDIENKMKGFKDLGFSTFVEDAKKYGGTPKAHKSYIGGTGVSIMAGKLIDKLFGNDNIDQLISEYNALGQSWATLQAEAKKYEDEYNKAQAQVIMNKKVVPVGGTAITTPTTPTTPTTTPPKTKTYEYQLQKEAEYLIKMRELEQELLEIEQERVKLIENTNLDKMIEDAGERVKREGTMFTFITDASGNLIDPIIDQIDKVTEYSKDAEIQRTTFAIDSIALKYKAENELRRKNAKENYDALIKQIEEEEKSVKEGIREGTATRQSLRNIQAQKKKIEQDYLDYLKEIDQEEIKAEADKNKEIEIEASKLKDKLAELDAEALAKKSDYNKQQLDGYQEYLDAQAQAKAEKDAKEKADDEAEIQRAKDKWAQINDIIKASADFYIRQSERRIEQLDKEIDQAQATYDILKDLAKQGNIDAQESLAEQQRIIEEANRKKLKEERRQQVAKLVETAFNTYNQKIQDGATGNEALTQTIRDITLLTQLVSTLVPAFEKGTENTGDSNGRGVDGRGGFRAILHPNERVLTKEQNKLIGDISNEDLAKLAFNYRANKLNPTDGQITSALNFSLLLNKVDRLTKVIQDKPETELNVGQITKTTLEIVEQTKRGNTKTYNRFKVNR